MVQPQLYEHWVGSGNIVLTKEGNKLLQARKRDWKQYTTSNIPKKVAVLFMYCWEIHDVLYCLFTNQMIKSTKMTSFYNS